MDPMHGPGILGVMFLGTVSSSSVHKCALILILVSSKLSSPLYIIFDERKMQAIRDNLSFSSQHLQTYPHLLHPFLLCYRGKDGPMAVQRPSQDLKLSLSVPILFQTFHEIPAAKTAFLTTFLLSLTSARTQINTRLCRISMPASIHILHVPLAVCGTSCVTDTFTET